MDRYSFNQPDVSAATNEIAHAANGIQSAALESYRIAGQAAAGLGAAVEHSVLAAATAGAAEISPIIQMIMRMPGHIGLLNSFFEMLGNFFMAPAQELLHGIGNLTAGIHFDLSHIGIGHIGLPSAEHFHFDMSLLPGDAPIFGHGALGGHGISLISGKTEGLLGSASEHFTGFNKFNISGQADLAHPQYEGGGLSMGKPGEALSGPSMTEANPATHLASPERLFSDRLGGLGGAQNHLASSSATTTTATTPTFPNQSPMNVNGSTINATPDSMPAVANANDAVNPMAGQNVSDSIGQATQPAGSLDAGNLGNAAPSGDNQLLASNMDTPKFYGQPGTASLDSSSMQQPAAAAAPEHGSLLTGLKAKQLSLGEHMTPSHNTLASTSGAAHTTSAAHAATHTAPAAASHSSPAAADASSHHAYQTVDHGAQHSAAHASDAAAHHSVAAHHATRGIDNVAHKPAHGDLIKQAKQPEAAHEQVAAKDGATQGAGDKQVADSTKTVAEAKDAAVGSTTAGPASYTIRAGDCLWNIAKDQLGSAAKWSDIYKMNADLLGSNPGMVHAGTTIQLPGHGTDLASAGSEATKYVVKPGDNLWNISKNTMGDGTKWSDLYKANSDLIGANPRMIMPGQELSIPGAGGAANTLAQASNSATSNIVASSQTAASGAASGVGAAPMDAGAAAAPEAAMAPNSAANAFSPQEVSAVQSSAAPVEATAQVHAPAMTQLTPHEVNFPAGAAGADELVHSIPVNSPNFAQAVQQAASAGTGAVAPAAVPAAPSVVNSSMGADLANFLKKAK